MACKRCYLSSTRNREPEARRRQHPERVNSIIHTRPRHRSCRTRDKNPLRKIVRRVFPPLLNPRKVYPSLQHFFQLRLEFLHSSVCLSVHISNLFFSFLFFIHTHTHRVLYIGWYMYPPTRYAILTNEFFIPLSVPPSSTAFALLLSNQGLLVGR